MNKATLLLSILFLSYTALAQHGGPNAPFAKGGMINNREKAIRPGSVIRGQHNLSFLPSLYPLPAAVWQGSAQQKSMATGGRQYAMSYYTGTGPATFTPKDSEQYFYPTPTANVYSQESDFSYNGAWHNDYQYYYTYDANGYLTQLTALSRNAATAAWDSSEKAFFTNNAAGKVTYRLGQRWNAATGAWVNASNDIYTYNAANYRTDWVHQVWSNGAWTNSTHYLYTNNASGNIVQQISQNWISGAWNNLNREDYTYDANGLNVTQHTYLKWNAGTGSWVNYNIAMITLNSAGMPAQYLYQNWDPAAGIWTPFYRITYTYDASGNLILSICEKWRAFITDYENYYEVMDTFNTYSQLLTRDIRYWTSGAFRIDADAERYNYYYEPYAATGAGSVANNGGAKLSVFPNPVNTDLHLSVSWDAAQSFTAAITDMAGRIYSTLSAPPAKDFNTFLSVKELPAGNYMLSIRGSKGSAASQMITVGR